MYKKAVYAGSFDPVTYGHLWIIQEAAKLFDELIVSVGEHPGKSYTFSGEDRINLLSKVTLVHNNVTVDHFEGKFLVNYARELGANYIVRGIRSASDYEYERTMRHINADLQPNITTVILLPPRDMAEVSSTMVKGLVGSQGWENIVAHYVPSHVQEFLLANQEILLKKT